MIRNRVLGLSVAAVAALVGACKKEQNNEAHTASKPSAETAESEVQSPETPAPDSPAPEPTAAADGADVQSALTAYESARALLAKDELTGLDQAGRTLETSAREAAKKAEGDQANHLTAMANAAAKLAEAKDLAAARTAFGEASRPLVALMSSNPDLAKGHHIFECGMSKGYPKWVQTSPDISNPYMGHEMPTCGSKSQWE